MWTKFRARLMRNNSLANKIFFRISIATAIITVLASAIAYYVVLSKTETQIFSQIKKYTKERAKFEGEKFRLAEENHLFLKQAILDNIEALGNVDPVDAFNKLVVPFDDGALRTSIGKRDPDKEAISFVIKEPEINADFRRHMVAIDNVVTMYGPPLLHEFKNLYITLGKNAAVIFWPEHPEMAYQLPADFVMAEQEAVEIADESHNPESKTVWTNLYKGMISHNWATSVSTPVFIEEKQVATIINDIFLDEWLERIQTDHSEDSYNLVISSSGMLVMHSEKMQLIKENQGRYDIAASSDLHLQSILSLVISEHEGGSIIKNPDFNEFIAINLIKQTNWYIITVYPNSTITKPAYEIAAIILFIGFISLILEMIIFNRVLYRFVTERLADISKGVIQVANGNLKVKLETNFSDEISDLAKVFNYMSESLLLQRDILDEKVKQRTVQFKLSENRFRTIFESMQNAIIQTDLNGKILLANQALVDMFGYDSVEELYQLESVAEAYVFPEDRETLVAKIIEKGSISDYKLSMKRKDGSFISGELNMNIITDENGNATSTLTIFKDISEQLSFERQLKNHAKEMQDLYDFIPLAYISYDSNGKVENVNKKTKTILGYSEEELRGRAPSDFYVTTSDGKAERIQQLLSEGKEITGEEVQIVKADGMPMWVRITVQPEFGGHSRRTMFEDITEQKNLEIELLKSKSDAELANQAKSEFLSRMSHELRTPLNAILGFAQMLDLDSQSLSKSQISSVEEILGAGQHLLTLINDVLDMAKIETGALELFIENINLDELIKESLSLIEPQLSLEKIEIINDVKQGYKVRADATRLKQVIVNLLTNALKYNSEFGCITLKSKEVNKSILRLTIIDTGNGLSVDDISQLFTPFERLDNGNNIEGTGIGLVISKSLIESMQGEIGVNSSIGKGCEFWIEIPLVTKEYTI